MKLHLPLCGLIFASLAGGCATSSTRYPEPPSLESQFVKADRNGDGRVSREEYGGLLIDEMALFFDKDGDGIISREEFLAMGGTASDFAKLDKDKNGKLTAEEVKSNKRAVEILTVAFVGADTNGDGYVTLAEAQAYQAKTRELMH